jgi:MFS family permease
MAENYDKAKYDKARLFLVSTMALASAGVAYSIRANTAADLQRVFLDPIDRAHSAEMIATILGVPFLAFAITIAIGSPLLDVIGMRVLLPLSPILLSVGMLMMAFAGNFVSGPNIYWALWWGDCWAWECRGSSWAGRPSSWWFCCPRSCA